MLFGPILASVSFRRPPSASVGSRGLPSPHIVFNSDATGAFRDSREPAVHFFNHPSGRAGGGVARGKLDLLHYVYRRIDLRVDSPFGFLIALLGG